MMKQWLILATVSLLVLSTGCGILFFKGGHDVKIINTSFYDVDIYLDGEFQFHLPSGATKVISDVDSGKHTLEARSGFMVLLSREEDIDEDFEWIL